MLKKSELFIRICELEDVLEHTAERVTKLEKRLKALEPKKERKRAIKK